ncbi:hypothetical protein MW887_000372 [Aspergillus wentii]|nr:hypothetical protein MW887_000372 [Aspergillus wentii]
MEIHLIVLLQFKPETSPTVQHDNGISHAFVSSFASFEDRDYFVKSDPAHIELVQNAKGYLDKVLVIDFTNGVLIKKL